MLTPVTVTLNEGDERLFGIAGRGEYNVFTDNPTVFVTWDGLDVTVEDGRHGSAATFHGGVTIIHQGDRAAWRARTFGGN
jgi:hypothetical protein